MNIADKFDLLVDLVLRSPSLVLLFFGSILFVVLIVIINFFCGMAAMAALALAVLSIARALPAETLFLTRETAKMMEKRLLALELVEVLLFFLAVLK